jgi:hypothetical protein
MKEKAQLLKADILADLETIETIYKELHQSEGGIDSDKEAIVIGYYLHNLYNAFENIFQRIAETFENSIGDNARWHTLLLKRMTLDIQTVRPRLLNDEAYDCLDELRRFRHLFRSMYTSKLDPERLKLVWGKARQLESLYRADLQLFLAYLDELG